MNSRRKYKVEEMFAAGMMMIEKRNCTRCHNDNCPTIRPESPFAFATQKELGGHDHFPLRQRDK